MQVETVEVVGSFLGYEAGVRCQFASTATVVFHRGQTELIEEAGLHIGGRYMTCRPDLLAKPSGD